MSAVGSAVSLVALPLLALQTVAVTDAGLGLLRSAQLIPFLVLALPFGLMADRLPRRRIMVVADLARMVLVGSTGLLAGAGLIKFPGLLTLALIVGCFTVAHEICYITIIPDLVAKSQLQDANRAIEMAQAGSSIAGPGLGGVLVSAISAAGAIVLGAVSFGVSALLLMFNHWPEPPRPVRGEREPVRSLLLAGSRYVRRSFYLGPLTAYLGVNNVFLQGFQTALLLYVVHDLRLSSVAVGFVVSAIGIGFLVGAAVSPSLGRRIGLGRLLVISSLVGALGIAVVAVPGSGALLPAAGALLSGLGSGLYNLQSIAIRQAVTPAHLLGRVNAAVKVVSYSAMATGAFLGGWASAVLSPHAVIAVASAGSLAATLPLLRPTLRRLTSLPSRQL